MFYSVVNQNEAILRHDVVSWQRRLVTGDTVAKQADSPKVLAHTLFTESIRVFGTGPSDTVIGMCFA